MVGSVMSLIGRRSRVVNSFQARVVLGVALWASACVSSPVLARQGSSVETSSRHAAVSPAVFEDVALESVYVTMRDGVKLAADIFRPAKEGKPHAEPLPLVWTHHRYVRAALVNGRRTDTMRQGTMRELVRRGYIVAAVDVRGGGASFGHYDGPFTPKETADAREIIEWFAAREYCDGNIGMYGGSYLGATQYMAASTGTPHLKAIIPSVAPGDLYAFCWAGGIYRDAFLEAWTALTIMLDNDAPVAPVDADKEGEQLAAARKVRSGHRNTNEQFRAAPYRDSIDEELQVPLYATTSPLDQLQEIERSGVAIYHLAGWLDTFVRDQLLLYGNLEAPQRIAIGPWLHQGRQRFDDFGEHIRWYDHYLKGIDNGIDREPPIHYFVMGAPRGESWRTAESWPLPNEKRTTFHFHARAADRTDGLLSTKPARKNPGRIEYVVDYSTTTGESNRWRNAHGGPGAYGDMTPNDEKGIHFTTAVLAADTEVTGHPVVKLWVQSTADDGDFFAYLEEVDTKGVSNYVTEGALRASHRRTSKAPYDTFGLPYHRSFETDMEPIADTPVLLEFDLHPTANLFDAGHRIRVTITCADRDNQETPILNPAPTITLHCRPEMPSSIVLPVIPAK